MPVKAKTKASQLIERINALRRQEEMDEFTLRKIRKEVEALQLSDAFNAYILFGSLASIEQDLDGVRDNYSKALKMRPDDRDANINYSISLNNLGFFTEAREFAEKAYPADQADLVLLDYLINRSWVSGRIRDAQKWLERWDIVNPKSANELTEFISNASELLDENGVSDDDVERLLQLKISVLHKQKIYPSRSIGETLEDEDSCWLNYFFEVRLPPKEVVELNFKAAEKLAKSDIPTYVTDSVIVTFTSAGS